ncbi:hypothetical protein BCV72DRAFT_226584 [Rhizopus microsporus var. microsporus]|uniref:Uncharacterized protein n=2 Tax=Rhizopus microsporus TaxID=58291 RepID=A0A2G4SFF8_RHIZD|nr:uncharacterized protein RHIMIDRAFT_274556 [Rhizopus microsporus ATCC 52813]ORE07495.1 hypothetical protein BCV72DRAFT_226584 [Rhizopus microsporus var. microsporus]PHZ07504.1 hypothetical protein RHIMIDRAFT_274556 [Rhizopus microsporus ATCC 52813]
MNCQSCSGCFTGSSCSTKETATQDKTKFEDLLEKANSEPEEYQKEHSHVIPTVIVQLSKNVYASQTVLFKAYDLLERPQFIQLSKHLYDSKLTGEHIAWADEYVKGDIKQLLDILQQREERNKLLQYCDEQAEIYELFTNLPSGTVRRIGKTG